MRKPPLIASPVALCLAMLAFGQTTTAQDAAKLASLRKRAEAGDPKGQSELGFMYEL
jgi:TPR repeat protein